MKQHRKILLELECAQLLINKQFKFDSKSHTRSLYNFRQLTYAFTQVCIPVDIPL